MQRTSDEPTSTSTGHKLYYNNLLLLLWLQSTIVRTLIREQKRADRLWAEPRPALVSNYWSVLTRKIKNQN